jgi:hypothetical protein
MYSVYIRRGLLQTRQVLHLQRAAETSPAKVASCGQPAFPFPVFGVSIRDNHDGAVLVPPAWNVQPIVWLRGVKEMSVVNT